MDDARLARKHYLSRRGRFFRVALCAHCASLRRMSQNLAGANLRALRQARALTQCELAAKLRLASGGNLVSRWECKGAIDPRCRVKLARFFGVDASLFAPDDVQTKAAVLS